MQYCSDIFNSIFIKNIVKYNDTDTISGTMAKSLRKSIKKLLGREESLLYG